jgi:hypothetical protein
MQTYLVHTRDLHRLNRDLGWRAAIGFHVLMGGLIASALVHPLVYALLLGHWLEGGLLAPAETLVGRLVWTIVWINLALCYTVSILVGILSVWRRGRPGLAMFALLTPLYWLLISLAAYRAVYQLARNPLPLGEDRARLRPTPPQAALATLAKPRNQWLNLFEPWLKNDLTLVASMHLTPRFESPYYNGCQRPPLPTRGCSAYWTQRVAPRGVAALLH